MRLLIFLFCLLFPFSCFAEWGEHLPGVTDRIPSESQVLYLTLDACGGGKGKGYDRELIDFLRKHQVKATLFMNARWIDANPAVFMDLAKDPLFQIANHGMTHRPASVSGKKVYGIRGTRSKEELVTEVNGNAFKIQKLTGALPKWYRSGTAYYDSESVSILLKELGFQIAGFAVSLDAGATLPVEKVHQRALSAKSGDILLAHMNHPESATYEGLSKALPELLSRGFTFEHLP